MCQRKLKRIISSKRILHAEGQMEAEDVRRKLWEELISWRDLWACEKGAPCGLGVSG